MSNPEQSLELSEAENIELNRRVDIAYGLIPEAISLSGARNELDEQIKNESKALKRYYIVIFVALLIHFFVLDGEKFTWATFIAVAAGVLLYARQYDLQNLMARRQRYSEKLNDLDMTWQTVIGYRNFLDVYNFVKGDHFFDDESEDFQNWWSVKVTCILQRVCGAEKGWRIGEDWARRNALLRKRRREEN